MGHFTPLPLSHTHAHTGMLYVIVEYCCNGNLLKYLRSKRKDQSSPLTARQCVDMAAQVATGMEFLASKDVRSHE